MNNEINQLIELKNRLNKKFENINANVFVDDYNMVILKFIHETIILIKYWKVLFDCKWCEIPFSWRTSDRFHNNIPI